MSEKIAIIKPAYAEKNDLDYEEITDLLNKAIEKIAKNPKLPATQAEVVRQTGVCRGTVLKRGFPKEELGKIKLERKVLATLTEVKKIDSEKELEEKLDNAKVELIHWFTLYNSLELNYSQLLIKEKRKQETLDWHKRELAAEKEKVKKVEVELEQLKRLMQ